MAKPLKSLIVAIGSVALLSGQTASAAAPRIDPLVSLSALGTAQSRAAVCAAGASAAAAGAATAGAASVAQSPAPGCVLPVTDPAPVAAAPPAPLVAPAAAAPKGIGTLPLLLGLAAIVAAAALILSKDGDDGGDLTPISPA